MNLKDFQILALRTLAPQPNLLDHRRHAAYGLVTESGELIDNYKRHIFYGKELDLTNLKEEIGDLLWYVAVYYKTLDLDIPDFIPDLHFDPNILSEEYALRKIVHHSSASLSYYVDGCSLDYDLVRIMYFAEYILTKMNIPLEDCLQSNIAKLQVRFPDKFTKELALSRDIEGEQNVL